MKKTMPKPVNWQDFESLCKKLWGAIWECDNIKKNGRAGQAQHGVDVYGIPKDKSDYYGIQCKGKDDYTNAALTESEIDEEIKKALTFKPELYKFIFTTTANKDAKLEEYIRLKNKEMVSQRKFQVDIFSWEDIVDLIEENKTTYEWYLKDVLHKDNYNFAIEINGNDKIVELKPIFDKTIVNVRRKLNIPNNAMESLVMKIDSVSRISRITTASARIIWNAKKINHSLSELKICFFNTGDTAIEHYKIIFSTDCGEIIFKENNYENIRSIAMVDLYNTSNYYIDDQKITYNCSTERPILVPNDGRRIDAYIQLPTTPIEFDLHYKLLSRSFNTDGTIHFTSTPQFDTKYVTREPNEGEYEGSYENITFREETVEQ